MIKNIGDVVRALEELIGLGIISNYAIGGAIGALFWDEVTATYDLDVFVQLAAPQGTLIDMGPIYQWATERGFPQSHEHIKISGIPVQLVPAPDQLSQEAIEEAAVVDIDGVGARVIRPEYLIAMWLSPPANNAKRKERAARLRESSQVDQVRLTALLERYHLSW